MKILLFIILSTSLAFSQTFKTIKIDSKSLNEAQEIQIYLPDSYDTSNKKYPVLYILDGQWHFINGVGIQKSLRLPGVLPEMIVVGITNKNTNDPLRRTILINQSDKYIQFLEKELIPFIDKEYRSSVDRVLFGWERGADFANYALFTKPNLFNAALISNGSWDDIDLIDTFIAHKITDKKYLYIANSSLDIYTVESSDLLAKKLKEKSPNQLIWKYQLFNDEAHGTTAYLALYHGLRYYYHDFGPPIFSDIKGFVDFGGIPKLKDFFVRRGKRYSFPTEIDDLTKRRLISLAYLKNNIKYFDLFINEFKDTAESKRYDSPRWQNIFGQFYLKHKRYTKAINYLKTAILKYPKSEEMAEMHYGLGQAYLHQEKETLASSHFEQAIEIAEKSSDQNLETYKKQLSDLKNTSN
ncbi:MAG: tetratricopeptide repeat protein [Flavobacteriaceae bacterium]|nr:tetratricopeptide repeat protein [Flavobacteriaceae bacterium]